MSAAVETPALPDRAPRARSIRLPFLTWFGLVVLVLLTGSALLAPLIAPYDPTEQYLQARLAPPMSTRTGVGLLVLGSDALGRDVLSRLLYGAQLSVLIGLLATAGQAIVGTALGMIAGYRRGLWDIVIMRIVDMQLTIPFLALAIALAAVLGPSLTNMVIVLVVTGWVTFARMVRGEVLSIRERTFVEAARSLGGGDTRILLYHILPNVANSLLVLTSFQVARTILSESTLSFLGLGVQPPTPTWGSMVADGRNYITSAWWVSTMPGLIITLFVLATNLLGNWIRDVLDPIRKRRA